MAKQTVAQLEKALRATREEAADWRKRAIDFQTERDAASVRLNALDTHMESLIGNLLAEREDLSSRIRRIDLRIVCLRSMQQPKNQETLSTRAFRFAKGEWNED